MSRLEDWLVMRGGRWLRGSVAKRKVGDGRDSAGRSCFVEVVELWCRELDRK